MNRKLIIGILGAALLGGLLWQKSQAVLNPSWEQATMGTACHITLAGSLSKSKLAALREQIDAVLEDVNARMSIWSPETEISKFNDFHPSVAREAPLSRGNDPQEGQSLEPFPISPEFAEVVQRALTYSAMTDGAFDPTVKPLVEHWGFGPRQRLNIEQERSKDELAQIMQAVGWQKLKLENGALIKMNPNVQLDLSAIAKGYGVDRVAEVICTSGHTNFIVEIGGEIVAEGTNRSGNPWRVGIESPEASGKAFGSEIFQTLEISGKAMASSGDYRNFQVRADGTRYSHIIDPHSGMPAQSDVAAVTVIAAHCMDADAIATALCVMGSKKGFQWLETHPEFQALFILHTPGNPSFISKATRNFPMLGK